MQALLLSLFYLHDNSIDCCGDGNSPVKVTLSLYSAVVLSICNTGRNNKKKQYSRFYAIDTGAVILEILLS